MGLRTFHILFIVVSSLLMAGLAFACFKAGSTLPTWMGVCSILGMLLLLIYGVWFWRKLANLKVK